MVQVNPKVKLRIAAIAIDRFAVQLWSLPQPPQSKTTTKWF